MKINREFIEGWAAALRSPDNKDLSPEDIGLKLLPESVNAVRLTKYKETEELAEADKYYLLGLASGLSSQILHDCLAFSITKQDSANNQIMANRLEYYATKQEKVYRHWVEEYLTLPGVNARGFLDHPVGLLVDVTTNE